MKPLSYLITVVVAAGCLGIDEGQTPGLGGAAPTIRLAVEDVASLSRPSGDDPCLCTTAECRQAWIDEHVGCDVCVVLTCFGHHIHTCHRCPEGHLEVDGKEGLVSPVVTPPEGGDGSMPRPA